MSRKTRSSSVYQRRPDPEVDDEEDTDVKTSRTPVTRNQNRSLLKQTQEVVMETSGSGSLVTPVAATPTLRTLRKSTTALRSQYLKRQGEEVKDDDTDSEQEGQKQKALPPSSKAAGRKSLSSQESSFVASSADSDPSNDDHCATREDFGRFDYEAYLLADNRIKFKPQRKKDKEVVPNDARKGRKPRKGKRGVHDQTKEDRLPERFDPNMSITKEAIRAAAEIGEAGIFCLENSTKHVEEMGNLLEKKIKPDFRRWIFYMREGFNILLYGFGSKLCVVKEFVEYLNEDFYTLRFDGLYPKLNGKQILSVFVKLLELPIKLKGSVHHKGLAEDVCQQLPEEHDPVFLIVTNLDALAINNPNTFNVLCHLAEKSWVHLLATADSLNTGVGITSQQMARLRFCWIHWSTFQSYEAEFNWTPNIFGESQSSKAGESTLYYVLKSLTGNSKKAFAILASLQLRKLQNAFGKKEKENAGVEFSELARKCREGFIAHSDAALKTLLQEFVDHKLVSQHGKGSGNILTIELDIITLEKYVKENPAL